jgi:predicted dinucleotide-utilizing enzyme
VGLIGCGLINYEITRFLLAALSGIENLLVFDLDLSRAIEFKNKCKHLADIEVEVVGTVSEVLTRASVISLATTAIKPHISDLSKCGIDIVDSADYSNCESRKLDVVQRNIWNLLEPREYQFGNRVSQLYQCLN